MQHLPHAQAPLVAGLLAGLAFRLTNFGEFAPPRLAGEAAARCDEVNFNRLSTVDLDKQIFHKHHPLSPMLRGPAQRLRPLHRPARATSEKLCSQRRSGVSASLSVNYRKGQQVDVLLWTAANRPAGSCLSRRSICDSKTKDSRRVSVSLGAVSKNTPVNSTVGLDISSA